MPGRGDSLPSKIIDDFVRSTLALQFAEVQSTDVPVQTIAPLTIFSMDFYPVTHKMALHSPKPRVHKGMELLEEAPPKVKSLALDWDRPAIQVPGFLDEPLKVYREPVLADMHSPWHRITFANVRRPIISSLQIPGLPEGRLKLIPIEKFKAIVREKRIPTSTVTQQRYNLSTFTGKSKPTPTKLFALPIHRKSVPLNRFTPEQIQRFRKALGDKEKTRYTNVQVSVVYDRMHMMLYSTITPDKTGNLVCTPKSEYIGKNHPRWGHSTNPSISPGPAYSGGGPIPFYLVFGTRMDTGSPIRAIVTMSVEDEDKSPHKRTGKEGTRK